MARLAPAGTLARLAAILAATGALAAPRAASAVAVWTALSLEKIRPSEPARDAPSAAIAAARNEWESFQVVVTGAATGVRAVASPLVGPGEIDGVSLSRVDLIDCQYPSSLDSPGTGWWPDALVPDVDQVVHEQRNAFPFAVSSGQSRAIWVDVFVPPSAVAGTYTGTVTVTWDGGGSATVPVTLTVWPFALPSTASLKSAFGLSWGSLIVAHGVQDNTDAFSSLRARYGQFGLDHRISLSSMDDGNPNLDHFAAFYGGLIDGTAPTQLASARLTNVNFLGSSSDYGTWATFFKGRGWFDRLFQYTCDEPSDGSSGCTWSDIAPRAQLAKAADPDFRTLVTTTIQAADAHGVTPYIDVMVPVINQLDDKSGTYQGNQRSAYDAFLAADPRHEVWTYQSCMSHGCGSETSYYTGWPTYMIDAPAVRNRAMEWLSFRYDVSGELYYETTMAYDQDPWSSQWEYNGNGDGTLFYPGTVARIGGSTDIPVASIRLDMIRDGMEDYEYLKLLADSGPEGAAYAHQIADGLFPTAYQTGQSPQALLAARQAIADKLVALGAVGAPPTSDAGGTGASGADGGAGGVPLKGGGCAAGGAAGLFALAGLVGAVRIRRRRKV